MLKKLHVCIDCGGSKTSAVVAATGSGSILTHTLGGPSNFTYLGVKDFSSILQETLNRALADENVKSHLGAVAALPATDEATPFYSAWIAVSGVDTPTDVQSVSEAMSELLGIPVGPRLQVTNDTHVLAAPLSTQKKYSTCMVAIAGTGSCVASFKKLSDGLRSTELARTGGYGWILGDEGGGFHVGRETVRELCLQDDVDHLQSGLSNGSSTNTVKHPTCDLKSLVLEHFGLPTTSRASDIFAELYAADPNPVLAASQVPDSATTASGHLLLERQQRLSRLAPSVFKAAFPPSDSTEFIENPIAVKIVTMCASALADMIILLCAPPATTFPESSKYIIANQSLLCLGGSLVKQQPYRDLLFSILKGKGHEFAEVVYVSDCERGGIEALVAQARMEKP